ncbi:MAG: ROK family transcriptional regulator [Solirubrobacteraceae bacterium]
MSALPDHRWLQDDQDAGSSKRNLLRQLSEQAVLHTIFRDGPITRPEIAAQTSLSKPTVSAAVRRLELAQLVRTVGEREGRRGRKPMAYAVRDRSGFVIGIDIGGTNLRVGAADIFGEFVAEEQQRTSQEGARAVSNQVIEMVSNVVSTASANHGRLLALSVSTPGVVDQASQRVTTLAYNVSPDGHLDEFAALGRRFAAPVLLENNVNLSAIGEQSGGLGRGVSNFVFVAVGAGVGMGIIVGDELVRGVDGAAGEIGYLPSGLDPFNQRHRLHGGLEDEIGATAVLRTFYEHPDQDGATPDSVALVFELATRGNSAAQATVDHVAQRLGAAIASVCVILNPALVVLGGGIGANRALLSPVRAAVAALIPLTVRIETSRLGEKAALQGAIAVGLRQARDQLFSARHLAA